MRETSYCLFLTIIKKMLLKHLTLDDLLNFDHTYFEQMVSQIYPTDLPLNKANSSDTEALLLDLDLSITNGIVSYKIYKYKPAAKCIKNDTPLLALHKPIDGWLRMGLLPPPP